MEGSCPLSLVEMVEKEEEAYAIGRRSVAS